MNKFLRMTITYLALVWLFLCATPLPARPAKAAQVPPTSGSYAYIADVAYFYSTPRADKPLFVLPTTYFVRLLDYGESVCRVEYLYDSERTKALVGYAKTNDLTFVDYTPTRPYFYYVFEVSYRLDATLPPSDVLDELKIPCAYYGDYTTGGESYCYVLRGDTFGYVPKPNDLVVPKNTEHADRTEQAQPPTAEASENKGGSTPTQIAILVALCLLVPLLAALILKPPRRPPYDLDG